MQIWLLFWASSAPSQGFGNILVQTHDGFCRFSVKRQVFGKTGQSDFPEYTPLSYGLETFMLLMGNWADYHILLLFSLFNIYQS